MNYEAPNVLELGEATTLVLGEKSIESEIIPNEPRPELSLVDMDE
jgi:hypothetical protein